MVFLDLVGRPYIFGPVDHTKKYIAMLHFEQDSCQGPNIGCGVDKVDSESFRCCVNRGTSTRVSVAQVARQATICEVETPTHVILQYIFGLNVRMNKFLFLKYSKAPSICSNKVRWTTVSTEDPATIVSYCGDRQVRHTNQNRSQPLRSHRKGS